MILECAGVTKRFGGLVALNSVDICVEEGQILGIIGPNGAGKSTLLNVIAGVFRPTAGAIRFCGRNITGLSPEKVCKSGIARTFQIPRPFPKMTALENVLVAASFGRRELVKDPRQIAEQMLDYVGFTAAYTTPASSLSTAQMRRLDVARALASDPRLLLLDETAAGLTPIELADLQELILKIRQRGVTILIVEHLMRLIMQLCDQIVVLQYGQNIAAGTPGEIASNPAVAEAYLGTTC